MKKTFTLCLVAITFLGLNPKQTYSQINVEPETFQLSELNPYFTEYFSPFAKSMAASMGGGWTHTANVHGVLGFDITISASATKVPAGDKTFNPQSLNMPGYTFSSASTPTMSGSDELTPSTITRSFANPELDPVEMDPGVPGLKIGYGGMFALQGAIGLPKGTELILRFIPNVSKPVNNVLSASGDFTLQKTGMWGFGVKHDIKQWIPVLAKVPFLQISGLVTYSKFYTGFSGGDIKITPDRFGATSDEPASTWDNQKFDIGMSSFTGNLLIGASIPVFQPYIGVGFNSAKFEGGFVGDYPIFVGAVDSQGNASFTANEIEKDPMVAKVKSSNMNFQAGARLKLGFFVFHYTYTIQQYAMHSGGLAFTFR